MLAKMQRLNRDGRQYVAGCGRWSQHWLGTSASAGHCPLRLAGALPEERIHGIPTQSERSSSCGPELRRRDNELQADPQLAEGPASGTRVAIYAIAIAVVLGV